MDIFKKNYLKNAYKNIMVPVMPAVYESIFMKESVFGIRCFFFFRFYQ